MKILYYVYHDHECGVPFAIAKELARLSGGQYFAATSRTKLQPAIPSGSVFRTREAAQRYEEIIARRVYCDLTDEEKSLLEKARSETT